MSSSNGLQPSGQPPANGSSNGPVHPASNSMVAAASAGNDDDDAQPLPGPPLADLLTHLEDYVPTIPDAVTQHYLSTAGVHTDDPRVVRLVSLAAQKFISDIANDALQHCKMRGTAQQQASKKSKDRKLVLTVEDLALALADQGVTLKKPPYYV